MAQEIEFLNEGGVLVTNTRVVNPNGDTFSLANITSCKSRYTVNEGIDKQKRKIKNLLLWGGILLGIILMLAVKFYIGLIVAAIGVIASFFIKDTFQFRLYQIYLGSASGETDAIQSDDEGFINRIVTAINRAIVERG